MPSPHPVLHWLRHPKGVNISFTLKMLLATLVFNVFVALVLTPPPMTWHAFKMNLIISNLFGLSFWLWSVLVTWYFPENCKRLPYIFLQFLLGLSQGLILNALVYEVFRSSEFIVLLFWGSLFGGLAILVSLVWIHKKEADWALEKQSMALTEAKLLQLQSQIEPHFLFNTLAHIQAYIQINPQQANELLDHLTQLLRTTLNHAKNEQVNLIPLLQELTALQHYLAIQQIRLGSRLTVNWQLDESCHEVLIPPLLLQPLVENAIKHGLENQIQGGTLTIKTRCHNNKLSVSVEDTGEGCPSSVIQSLNQTADSAIATGLGLRNIQMRLRYHYANQPLSEAFKIQSEPDKGTHITLQIPIQPN